MNEQTVKNREIRERIEARDYDVFSEVVCIPRPRRALIALRTWARGKRGQSPFP